MCLVTETKWLSWPEACLVTHENTLRRETGPMSRGGTITAFIRILQAAKRAKPHRCEFPQLVEILESEVTVLLNELQADGLIVGDQHYGL